MERACNKPPKIQSQACQRRSGPSSRWRPRSGRSKTETALWTLLHSRSKLFRLSQRRTRGLRSWWAREARPCGRPDLPSQSSSSRSRRERDVRWSKPTTTTTISRSRNQTSKRRRCPAWSPTRRVTPASKGRGRSGCGGERVGADYFSSKTAQMTPTRRRRRSSPLTPTSSCRTWSGNIRFDPTESRRPIFKAFHSGTIALRSGMFNPLPPQDNAVLAVFVVHPVVRAHVLSCDNINSEVTNDHLPASPQLLHASRFSGAQ